MRQGERRRGLASNAHRLRPWPLALLCLILLAACLPIGPDYTKVQYPEAPAGDAIAGVVDVPLPNEVEIGPGLMVTFDPNLALDDRTGDLYFLGLPRDKSTRPSSVADSPNALYRIDVKTQTSVQVAGLTMGEKGLLSGVAATNGWVFWVEWSVTAPDTLRRVHFAAKSDGSSVTQLADVTLSIKDSTNPFSTVYAQGFTAGAGTAMWFGDPKQGSPVSVFDTSTATARKVIDKPRYPGLGQVNGDRILLWGKGDKYSMNVRSITSSESVPATTKAIDASLGVDSLFWVAQAQDSSDIYGCSFASAASLECPNPIQLRHWDKQGADVECVAGSYAVVRSAVSGSGLALIGLENPQAETPLLQTTAHVMCGGKSVIFPWWTNVEDENGQQVQRTFVRIITTTG